MFYSDNHSHPDPLVSRPHLLLCALGLASLLAPDPTGAHSGRVVLVHPIEQIILDGDLFDWLEEAQCYPYRKKAADGNVER